LFRSLKLSSEPSVNWVFSDVSFSFSWRYSLLDFFPVSYDCNWAFFCFCWPSSVSRPLTIVKNPLICCWLYASWLFSDWLCCFWEFS
jgi:hypothetical protein